MSWDYSPLTKQQVIQIIHKSVTNGSCIRCALSSVQCFDAFVYQPPAKKIVDELHRSGHVSDELNQTYDESRVCVVCRGLFQDDILFHKIPERVAQLASSITFEKFGVSVQLHHAFHIRDHLMTVFSRDGIYQWSGVGEVIRTTDRKKILREIFGFIMNMKLRELLRRDKAVIHDQANPQLNIEIKTSEDDEIPDESESHSPAKKKNKYTQRKKQQKQVKANDHLQTVVREKSLSELSKQYDCPPTIPSDVTKLINFEIQVYHSPIYFSGKYLKLQRGLPQSPWLIQDNEEATSSVQGSLEEYIGNVLQKYTKASSYKFDSAGREDIDVRMLGKGRPFVFTVLKPEQTAFDDNQILEIQQTINETYKNVVQVNTLRLSFDTTVSKMMREGAVEKKKRYRCLIWFQGILEDERIQHMESLIDLQIAQNTPVRVLHRRSAQIRPKVIHELKCVEKLNDHYMILDLTTSAGTYVKEFVHSDFGRTVPSLGTILASNKSGYEAYKDAQILQLDVMDIEME